MLFVESDPGTATTKADFIKSLKANQFNVATGQRSRWFGELQESFPTTSWEVMTTPESSFDITATSDSSCDISTSSGSSCDATPPSEFESGCDVTATFDFTLEI
jgi:hypothetical protein